MKGDYWFGPDDADRRIKHAKELTPEIQSNGDDVDRRIRAVYAMYASRHGARPEQMRYSSGWRPKAINDVTANSGKFSNHIWANAGDVECAPDGHFAWWCFRNLAVLEQHGLWMEHPVATVVRAQKGGGTPWCHLQRIPPASGARVFFPDSKSVAEWSDYQSKLAKVDHPPVPPKHHPVA